MWKKFNGRLWPSLAVKVERLTDVIIVEFIIPLRVQHRWKRQTSSNKICQCRKGIQLQFCLSFTSSCICVSFFRFLSFFQEGEGVHIHFFKPKQGKAILMTYRTIKSAPPFSEKCCGLIDGSKLEKVNYRSFWRGVR